MFEQHSSIQHHHEHHEHEHNQKLLTISLFKTKKKTIKVTILYCRDLRSFHEIHPNYFPFSFSLFLLLDNFFYIFFLYFCASPFLILFCVCFFPPSSWNAFSFHLKTKNKKKY